MKILSVDLGDARTGLACCDPAEMLASPVGVIHDKDPGSLLQKVAGAVREHGAGQVVVGYPKNMNNTVGERALLCRQFAQELELLAGVPVLLWDERGSTVSAHRYLNETNTRGKKRKNVVDAVAAVIILESYLGYRRNQSNRNPGESTQNA